MTLGCIQARELGLKAIDEDELLELIQTRPGKHGSMQSAPKKEKSRRGRAGSETRTETKVSVTEASPHTHTHTVLCCHGNQSGGSPNVWNVKCL